MMLIILASVKTFKGLFLIPTAQLPSYQLEQLLSCLLKQWKLVDPDLA